MAEAPDSPTVSVNSPVPVALGLSYRLNVTVPVGLSPPLTVAWSPITYPINVHAGCGVVVMVGVTRSAFAGTADSTVIAQAVPKTVANKDFVRNVPHILLATFSLVISLAIFVQVDVNSRFNDLHHKDLSNGEEV